MSRRRRYSILALLTLPIAVYLMADQYESTRLSRHIAEIHRRGEPVNLDDTEAAHLTLEQREAARMYAEAADLAVKRAAEGGRRFTGLDLERVSSPAEVGELEAAYQRHNGAPPANLEALGPAVLAAPPVDPLSGKSLVYKAGPDSYIVYSVGTDRVDNGGALYGIGAMATAGPRGANPGFDFGIRVSLAPQRNALHSPESMPPLGGQTR